MMEMFSTESVSRVNCIRRRGRGEEIPRERERETYHQVGQPFLDLGIDSVLSVASFLEYPGTE